MTDQRDDESKRVCDAFELRDLRQFLKDAGACFGIHGYWCTTRQVLADIKNAQNDRSEQFNALHALRCELHRLEGQLIWNAWSAVLVQMARDALAMEAYAGVADIASAALRERDAAIRERDEARRERDEYRRENAVLRSNSDNISSENASLSRHVDSMAMRIASLSDELAKPEDVRLREVLDALDGRAVIFDSLGSRVVAVLDDLDEFIARAGEAERAIESARVCLSCVADSMTEHAYQELASVLEAPPRFAAPACGAKGGCDGAE